MSKPNPIQEYVDTVCNQVRWKKSHQCISREINSHIIDQRDAYMEIGQDKETATKNAIIQMGDPVMVGTEYDMSYKPAPQYSFLVVALLLTAFGGFLNFGLLNRDLQHINIVSYCIAIFALFACYFIDFTVLAKKPFLIYLASVVLFTFMLSNTVYTANYIKFFSFLGFTFNLRYLALLSPIFYSLLLYTLKDKGYLGVILAGVGYLPLAVILLLIPTMSGFLLFTFTALILLCGCIKKGWFNTQVTPSLALVLIPTLIVFLGFIYTYRYKISWHFSSRLDYTGNGYVLYNINKLLMSAKFIGKSSQPLPDFLNPLEANFINTDFALTYIIYNFGYIALIILTAIFIVFCYTALKVINNQKSVLGYLVAMSCFMTIMFQTLIYGITNLGFLNIGGFSLPFISYSNTSLIINCCLLGLMLSVFKTGEFFSDYSLSKFIKNKFFDFTDGKLTIDFNFKHSQ